MPHDAGHAPSFAKGPRTRYQGQTASECWAPAQLGHAPKPQPFGDVADIGGVVVRHAEGEPRPLDTTAPRLLEKVLDDSAVSSARDGLPSGQPACVIGWRSN